MQEDTKLPTAPPLPGADLVARLNAIIQTLGTNFAGPDDPAAIAWAFATWADTGNMLLKRRNAANTAWMVVDDLLPTRPSFSAYVSGGQAIAAATMTKVMFGAPIISLGSGFSSGRFQPTTSGFYSLSAQVASSSSNRVWAALYKNGSLYSITYGAQVTGSTSIHDVMLLNGTSDYVEFYTRFETAGTVYGTDGSTRFNGYYVRPAQ